MYKRLKEVLAIVFHYICKVLIIHTQMIYGIPFARISYEDSLDIKRRSGILYASSRLAKHIGYKVNPLLTPGQPCI